MKRLAHLPLLCLWFAAASAILAAPIQNLKFVDVVKDVKVLNVATKQETTAKVGDILAPPNVIKTGADSRAELVAEDQTVTRVGANTIFSVEANSRDVNIAKGSVLFHSPAGKGGGNIKSAGATASVLGTTLIVGANQSGGFKVMLLEGKGQVTGAGGGASKLNAGQMSFAMPGQAPSQPLNFELKGQVSGSKLVGGFSKPLASIAKIEAAVAVQQTKLESGNLESTGLMIGDSPNTAFKVDPVVVSSVSKQVAAAIAAPTIAAPTKEVVKEAKEQIKQVIVVQEKVEPKTEVPTRDKLDPRFLLAVKASLNLTGNSTPDVFEQPIPITLEPVDAADQKSGNYTEQNYGAPVNIPGNREAAGLMTLLVAQDLKLAVDSVENSGGFFLNAPFVEGKNFSGILATQNIDINKSVNFLDSTEYDEASVAIPKSFLLSAGRTITAGSGTVMRADNAIFDIYTGGAGFSSTGSRDGFFTEISSASKDPLVLTNSMSWNDADGGLLRIQAPEIKFTNQTIAADTIEIGATGPINLSVAESTLGAIRDFRDQYDTAEASQKAGILNQAKSSTSVPLPLGFDGPEALAIQAYKVSIRSTGKPISITGVPIYTNNLSIASGFVAKVEQGVSIQEGSKEVALTSTAGVSVGQPVSGSGIPDGTVVESVNSANGSITLSNGVTVTDTVDLTIGTPSAAQVEGSVTLSKVVLNSRQGVNPNNEPQSLAIHATGDLTIIDSEFPYATTIDLRTNRTANLTSTNFQDIEDLSVWADQDITFEAVSVTGDMAENSKVSVTSKQGNIHLNNSGTEATLQTEVSGKTIKVPAYKTTRTVMVAKKVNFTANNGDIVINSYEFRGDGTGKQEVTAKAKEILGVYNTSLTDAAKVSLAANTVVLRDVSFRGGSDVTLKSKDGLVAADPGRNHPVQTGKVNFISGVTYGGKEMILTNGSVHRSSPLTHSQFQAALAEKHPNHDFSKLVIGQK